MQTPVLEIHIYELKEIHRLRCASGREWTVGGYERKTGVGKIKCNYEAFCQMKQASPIHCSTSCGPLRTQRSTTFIVPAVLLDSHRYHMKLKTFAKTIACNMWKVNELHSDEIKRVS